MPIYMQFEGIKGAVTAKGHEGWIELQSCQMGVHRNVTTAVGRGTNREATVPSVSEIVITKDLDDASTGLFRAALWGEGKKVTIDFVNSDGTIYLRLELTNTLVANYSVSGHGGVAHSQPMESLSLNFVKITYTTKFPPQDPKHALNTMKIKMAIGQLA